MRAILISALLLFSAASSDAQTLTPEELKQKIDERVSGLNEYKRLLDDPDPMRSIAAMEIMMESGDSQLQRMALEFGIYSANPAVRRAALEAYFNSAPVLEIKLDGSKLEDDTPKSHFVTAMRRAKGSVASELIGFVSYKVGEFDSGKSCYVYHADEESCFVRLSEKSVSLYIFKSWANLELNQEGNLVGEGLVSPIRDPIRVSVPVVR